LAIPDHQSLMLPVLGSVADRNEHVVNDIVSKLADQYQLSDEDRSETLSNGETVFHNRVWWARTYLLKAGLIESPMRGKIRVTQTGLDVLQERPARIDNKFLMKFPGFVKWKLRPGTKRGVEMEIASGGEESGTPQDIIESNYRRMRDTLAEELLEKIKSSSPEFFEKLVVELLVAMGYGGSREDAGKVIGRSRERGGIDGVIKEDKLGLDVIYVQAKRWKDSVGLAVVSQFSGSLEKAKATKGVLITTSWFTDDAKEFVEGIGKRIVLIDGEELTNLMITNGVGVTLEGSYEIKRIDPDYFEST
jgi:restriction system protein